MNSRTNPPDNLASPHGRFAPWNDPAVQPLVRFEGVSKSFSGVTAVNAVSLDIYQGEFFALLGPSGCGKTTLLRMLAGFETPDSGRILLDGADLSGVPPHRRPVNMMFQSYALFPHLTVAGNIAFGLKQDGLPKSEIAARLSEMVTLLRLDGLESRKPQQLSGGQRQRVALARALVKRPRVLLLDEPLAALDKKLRGETQFELMRLKERLGLTFVIVTHDQEEAMTVATRIGVMNQGRLIQVATPSEIYEQPTSRWVADFIGDVNLVEGRVLQTSAIETVIESGIATLRTVGAVDAKPGDGVCVALRPEKIRIGYGSPTTDVNRAQGAVWEIGYLGDMSVYKVILADGSVMKAAAPNMARQVEQSVSIGDRVWLSWSVDAGVVLTR